MNQSSNTPNDHNETEAIVLIKAAPRVSNKHGETVCCAAVDLHGNWLRLFPVSFRHLEDSKKFGRWDKIRFRYTFPKDDQRIESRRIDQKSIEITGTLKKSERLTFLGNLVVTSLSKEREEGRSLALLKPEIQSFFYKKKDDVEFEKEKAEFQFIQNQTDMFNPEFFIGYEPCPYEFKYRYVTDDGEREGTCQDWETSTTFYKWSKLYGIPSTLERMVEEFGETLPNRGIVFAMGTHSRRQDQWLINGIVRLDEVEQLSLI